MTILTKLKSKDAFPKTEVLKKPQLPLIVFLFLFAIFFTTCAESIEENKGENPYKGLTLKVSGQRVWMRNKNAFRISEVFIPYEEDHDIGVFVEAYDASTYFVKKESVGSGNITGSNLTFFTSPIEENKLMQWQYEIDIEDEIIKYGGWKSFFREWPDAVISDESTLGNMILLDASSAGQHKGMLDRQRITGTDSTITCVTILYVYVTDDCRITGKSNSGYTPGQYYYYTEGNLDLSLKKGLNLIYRSETYGKNFSGSAVISMEVKDPLKDPEKYKWIIEPGFGMPGIHF